MQNIFNLIRASILFLFSVILAACTAKPAQQVLGQHYLQWPEREAQLAEIVCWTLSGRVGVTTHSDGGSANLYWQQQANERFELQLWGTFGVGHVTVIGTADEVSLSDGRREYYAADTRSLVQAHTGWDLPIDYLHYWVRGLPVPGDYEAIAWDSYNHLDHLQQDGWQVDYLRYTSVNTIDLPSRINIKHADLQIRLIVNEWQLNCQ